MILFFWGIYFFNLAGDFYGDVPCVALLYCWL